MTAPRVTLLMTVRERYGLTLASIEDVLAKTTIPHRFVFAHGELPRWLDEGVDGLERAGRIERRRFPGEPWPQQLRQALAAELDTEFVAYIDNDITVSPGWIERLLECADATGAGAVGPLYLWGDGVKPSKVHMAGGWFRETPVEGGTVLEEEHRHLDADPGAITVTREPCDTLEFHCMLLPSALAKDGLFDERIVCVHEHIDVALGLRQRGRRIYLEPAAQVTYLHFAAANLEDIAMLRRRWDLGAMEASIAAFGAKWNVVTDDRSFGGVRDYVKDMRTKNDPVKPGTAAEVLATPMARAELPQAPGALMDLATSCGYEARELGHLRRALNLAAALFDGGYRPCGRAFVQHGIGMAGVLVRYRLSIDVVIEALLHAAYTHRRMPGAMIRDALAKIHPQIELRVRGFTQRAQMRRTEAIEQATPREVEMVAIEAANEIDMRFSGEYDHSGRADRMSDEECERAAAVLHMLGTSGMAQTLRAARATRRAIPPELQTRIHESYRLGPGQRPVKMSGGPV
jgi:hypothetical protein